MVVGGGHRWTRSAALLTRGAGSVAAINGPEVGGGFRGTPRRACCRDELCACARPPGSCPLSVCGCDSTHPLMEPMLRGVRSGHLRYYRGYDLGRRLFPLSRVTLMRPEYCDAAVLVSAYTSDGGRLAGRWRALAAIRGLGVCRSRSASGVAGAY